MTVAITPTKEHPVPYDMSPDTPDTLLDELATAANTVELQLSLGANLELEPADAEKEKKLLDSAVNDGKVGALTSPNTAFAAAAFLRTYGSQLALDVAKVRSAVTNKLMEIANCGDPRYELKALELLGKHSDVGLFTERSEVTINYKDPQSLENEIKERVKRLLNANVVDTVPKGAALDDELGVFEVENPPLISELEDDASDD